MIVLVISSMMTRYDYDIIFVNIINVTIMKISSLLLYLIWDKIIIIVISSMITVLKSSSKHIKYDDSNEIISKVMSSQSQEIIIIVISSMITVMRSSSTKPYKVWWLRWDHQQSDIITKWWDHHQSHYEYHDSEIIIIVMMTVRS